MTRGPAEAPPPPVDVVIAAAAWAAALDRHRHAPAPASSSAPQYPAERDVRATSLNVLDMEWISASISLADEPDTGRVRKCRIPRVETLGRKRRLGGVVVALHNHVTRRPEYSP